MKALSAAEAIGDGILSVPRTLFDGLIRTGEGLAFWDSDEEVKIGAQNERAYKALKEMLKYGIGDYNSPVEKAIRIILVHFYDSLPRKEQKKIIDAAIYKGLKLSSKVTTNTILSYFAAKTLVKNIVATAVVKRLFRYTTSLEFTLLSMQGVLYQAGAASDRLKNKFPKIYYELRRKNLDMIYFLIEKPMSKYLEAIRLNRMGLTINVIN